MSPKRPPTGSISLGNTSHGRLIRAAALPLRGPHHAVLPGYAARRTRYGTRELIDLILDAARQVARRYRGAKLRVGNISIRHGGDMKWSVSHNCGRDVDLAFYVRRGRRTVPAPSLVTIGRRLRSTHPRGYRFDLPRNWTLIRALLTHRGTRVQWIFLAHHLRRRLLEYARSHGASAALLAQAERVLKQPTDSLSHADHFHVRIYCSRNDRLEGCQDRAPFWPGVPTYQRAVAARIRMLLPGLKDPSPRIRRRVLDSLVRLDARQHAVTVARLLLKDPEPRNRRRVFQILQQWHAASPGVLAVLHRFLRSGDAEVRLAYSVLERLHSRRSTPALARGLRSDKRIPPLHRRGARVPEAWLAVQAARASTDLRLVPALIHALGHRAGRVRLAAARLLRRLTNHSFGYGWGTRQSRRHLARKQHRWKRWWSRNERFGRPVLLVRGFRHRRGRRHFDLRSRRTLRWLVALTLRADYLGKNAHELLCRVAGRRPCAGARSSVARHRTWIRWYAKRFPPRRRRHRVARRRTRKRSRSARRTTRKRRRLTRRTTRKRRRLAVARRRRATPRRRKLRHHPVRAPR